MKLKLAPLPATVLGIYGPSKNELPERRRYLHPDAATSILKLEAGPHRLRVSDMWRCIRHQALHAAHTR
ncbi:MAG TPA: hypothetical protein VJV78_22160 [Polyangiales bacterium]|nr:hypothetical protein [Polyangiales bacterium]